MFFNRQLQRRWALVLLSAGLLSPSCGIRFDTSRSNNKQAIPVESGAQSTGCLTGAAEQLSRFWNGKASTDEIEKLWTCVGDSLDLFLTRARGVRPGVYTPRQLRSFLQTYFLHDIVVSDELLDQAMAVKQLFIGGSPTTVTTQDIKKTKRLVDAMKRMSLDLLPHLPLPFSRANGEVSEDRVFQIARALQVGGATLLASIEQSGFNYPLERLFSLLDQLSLLPRAVPEEESAILWIKNKLPLIRALKVGFVGGKGELDEPITSTQWAHFVRTGIDAYSLYLRFVYLTEQFRLKEYPVGYIGSTRERFVNWASDVLSLIESAVAKRADRVIPYASVDEALRQYPWKASHGIEPDAIVRLMHSLNENALRSGTNRGISTLALQNLRTVLYDWSAGQQYLESNFGIKETEYDFPTNGSADRFRMGGVVRLPGIGGGLAGSSAASKPTDLNEILFLRPRPIFAENTSELTFPGSNSNLEHSFSEMSQINWMVQLGKVLVQSYGESPALGARVGGLRKFYDGLREVGIQLKIFDPADDKVPEKRFREANLFLPSSDGNGWLSRKEGTELLAYLVSTKVIMSRIHRDLTSRAKCGDSRVEDIFGWTVIDADCFRRNFYPHFKTHFPNWPVLTKFVAGLSASEQLSFISQLEVAARKGSPKPKDPINSSDLEGFVAVLQYVETVFQRFDRNDDGFMDDVEADAAFPIFRSTLKEVFARKKPNYVPDENELRATLRFLLVKGRAPADGGELKGWQYISGHFNKVQASRATLIGIFAEVSSSL